MKRQWEIWRFKRKWTDLKKVKREIDNGINILRGFHEKAPPRHTADRARARADPLMPGSVQYARGRASHLANEVRRRYDHLVSRGLLHIQAVIRDSDGALLPIELFPAEPPDSLPQ